MGWKKRGKNLEMKVHCVQRLEVKAWGKQALSTTNASMEVYDR